MKFSVFALTFPLTLYAASVSAQGRLIEQSAEGASRFCIYEGPTTTVQDRASVVRTGDQRRSFRTGLGEPCPSSLPRERNVSEGVAPPLATLTASRSEIDHRVCIYSYLGRDYRVRVPQFGSCPMTPNLMAQ